jgi:hypothetical protein
MEFKDLFTYGWGLLVPYLMHNHKRTQDKIDKVVEDHVKREEFNGTISSLRDEIHEGNQAVTRRLDSLLQALMEKK